MVARERVEMSDRRWDGGGGRENAGNGVRFREKTETKWRGRAGFEFATRAAGISNASPNHTACPTASLSLSSSLHCLRSSPSAASHHRARSAQYPPPTHPPHSHRHTFALACYVVAIARSLPRAVPETCSRLCVSPALPFLRLSFFTSHKTRGCFCRVDSWCSVRVVIRKVFIIG